MLPEVSPGEPDPEREERPDQHRWGPDDPRRAERGPSRGTKDEDGGDGEPRPAIDEWPEGSDVEVCEANRVATGGRARLTTIMIARIVTDPTTTTTTHTVAPGRPPPARPPVGVSSDPDGARRP